MINVEKSRIQDEAFEAIKTSGFNAAVLVATGVGKARLLINIIKYLKPKSILYLCDSTDNRDTTFPNQIMEWGEPWMFEVMDRMCFHSAYKLKGKKYDLLLSDEFDYSLTPAYSKVYFNNEFKNKVLVSATCDKPKLKILNKIVPLVYSKVAKEAENQGALNKTSYYFLSHKMTPYENKRYVNYNEQFAFMLRSDNVARYKYRLETLTRQRSIFLNNLQSCVEVTKSLLYNLQDIKTNKVLIFAGCIEQAERITEYVYHSKSKNNYLEDFNEGLINHICVVGKIDRGVNLKGVNNVIFTAPTRSSTKASQRTGRARRLTKDEVANVFFLIPMYRKRLMGELHPTVVQSRVLESAKDLDLTKLKYINYDESKGIFSKVDKI